MNSCSRRARVWPLRGGATGCGGAPRVSTSIPSYLELLTREAGHQRCFYARQRRNSRVATCPAYLLGTTRSWGTPPHARKVFLCFCPARRSQQCLHRSACAVVACTATHCGSGILVAGTGITTQPSTGTRTSTIFKEALSVARRVLQCAAAGESCNLRGNRTGFRSEVSLRQGVLQPPAGLVLPLLVFRPKRESSSSKELSPALRVMSFPAPGAGTRPGWWTL